VNKIKRSLSPHLRFASFLYLLLVIILFYLLLISRSGEIYTVWDFLHPAFLPVFFVATILLLAITFSSEKTSYKLLFVVLHSMLSNSLFVLIFPAGNLGIQQVILGRTRLIFDNVILNGWPPTPSENILGQIYNWFRGTNFQTAVSVILARMFGIDVYWTHLLLIPILWGTFIPISTFLVTKMFIQNENISALSSLLISMFPILVNWGTVSIPNSLGFIFFSYTLFFFLKYLFSRNVKTNFVLLMFCFFSFLAHFLSGIIALSLLVFTFFFKRYINEKHKSPMTAKILFTESLIFSVIFLPISLICLKLFYPINTYFSLEKLQSLSPSGVILAIIFGVNIEFELSTLLIHYMGPIIGAASILYVLRSFIKQESNKKYRATTYTLYLFTLLLILLTNFKILNLFMTGVPFAEGRLWAFQNLILIPFIALITYNTFSFLHRKTSEALNELNLRSITFSDLRFNVKKATPLIIAGTFLLTYAFASLVISAWLTFVIYRAYPHYAPLQTTSYELEAARYIESNVNERYIVVADQWMIFAGQMVVGIYNPRAFYFSHTDPNGISLFIRMKSNSSSEIMIEAMKYNNATTAFFIIQKPRLGSENYDYIVQQAQQNGLKTYKFLYFDNKEKLRIFYYQSQAFNG